MNPWIVAGACYVAGMLWLVREIRNAPLAKDCLPHSHRCAWCGKHMTKLDEELEREGAQVSHGICGECNTNLMGEI